MRDSKFSQLLVSLGVSVLAREGNVDEVAVAESAAEKKEAPPRPPPPKLFPDGDKPYEGDTPLPGMLFYDI